MEMIMMSQSCAWLWRHRWCLENLETGSNWTLKTATGLGKRKESDCLHGASKTHQAAGLLLGEALQDANAQPDPSTKTLGREDQSGKVMSSIQ